ncbi:MAG: PA2169 family four-helix-bundle protein [Sphingopyxis sp.]|nr:PA2169 family four-helix-bundle protein [Sphingopyxis sp.]
MSKHDISVLNGLITTTCDSVKGFEGAAEDAKSTRYSTMFADLARSRTEVAALLQAEVRTLGEEPEDSASFLGTAHRGFIDLKQVLTGKKDMAIIAEVEKSEDHIQAQFEAALRDSGLLSATLAAINQAFAAVKVGHDQASALKNSLA